MTGYLRQNHNIKVAKTRVEKPLEVAASINNQSRRSGTSQAVNLTPYHAEYFGQKILFWPESEVDSVFVLRMLQLYMVIAVI